MSTLEIEINVGLFVTNSIIALLIMVSNVFLISLIGHNAALWDVTGYLMVSLSMADLAVGVSLLTPLVYRIFSHQLSTIACDAMGFINSTTWVVSVYNLMLLSVDRYLAITHPYFYSHWVTLPRCLAAAVFVWIFAILLWILPLIHIGHFEFNSTEIMCFFDVHGHPKQWILYMIVIFGPTSAIILFSYTRILVVSIRQRRQIAVDSLTTVPQTINMKAVRMLALIVGAFYVAWLPFITEHLIKASWMTDLHTPHWLEISMHVLAASNSFWNPIIYVGTNRKLRETSLGMLKGICQCSTRTSVTPDVPEQTEPNREASSTF